MRPRFLDLLAAELFLLRKRTSTKALLAIWLSTVMFFPYVLEYLFYRNNTEEASSSGLASMLPERFAQTVIEGMPFYGGSIVLILGVLSVGSEFGWGNWKTLFTQQPGRGRIFAAKMTALGVAIIPFILGAFAIGAIASTTVATIENAPVVWPTFQGIVESMMAGWLVLAVWCAVGVFLATLTRGTSLAIGIGILWALVFEGLIGVFAAGISWMEWLVDLLLRANGYSLVRGVSDSGGELSTDGPGVFNGPYVSGMQAMLVLAMYVAIFLGVAMTMMRRRDVV